MQLDKESKQQLLDMIKEGKTIPSSFKSLLFPSEGEPMESEGKFPRADYGKNI